ncbi:MAG: hypothetical protein H6868_10270 [Rhodospirillales bacterium]|nr:hypothetical protein [Rhodospirillales bacterium]
MKNWSSLYRAEICSFGVVLFSSFYVIYQAVLIGHHQADWVGITLALLAFAVSIVNVVFIVKGRRNIITASEAIEKAARGDLNIRITGIPENKGEVAVLLWSVNHLLDVSEAFMRETQASMEHIRDGKTYRLILERGMPGDFRTFSHKVNQATKSKADDIKAFSVLTNQFDSQIHNMMDNVGNAAKNMQSTSFEMQDNAKNTANRATEMSSSAESTSNNVQTVAAASEELSASISEIARLTAQSSNTTKEAHAEVSRANNMIASLSESAREIGDVINLITEIADKTNLLALNATIEAARAGDAGKGFAVVANEVKTLAAQTTEATDVIARHIGAIQSKIGDTVDIVEKIGVTINGVNESATAVSAAVEEQEAATKEIIQSIQATSEGINLVLDSSKTVLEVAHGTESGSSNVLDVATRLSEQSSELRKMIEEYLDRCREQYAHG